MKNPFSEAFRILPDDWLNPLPLARWFSSGVLRQAERDGALTGQSGVASRPVPGRDFPPHAERPLEVDVGCGKGRFLLSRAASHPDTDFLGVDRMIGRLHKIDRKGVRRELKNIRWLRLDAYYAVAYMLPAESVSTYYIFFPDPWPKKRHHDHRLFNAAFLDALSRTLKPGGQVHFATDHLPYFEEVVAAIKADPRFAEIPAFEPADEERTDFELIYLGRTPIGRYSFRKE